MAVVTHGMRNLKTIQNTNQEETSMKALVLAIAIVSAALVGCADVATPEAPPAQTAE